MEAKRIFLNKRMLIISLLTVFVTAGIFLYMAVNSGINISKYISTNKEYTDGYSSYIDDIYSKKNEYKKISIFKTSENDFSNKNIDKTSNDYEKLKSITVVNGNYIAIEKLMNFKLLPFIIIVFLLYFLWQYFEEDKKNLKILFYSTSDGRFKLALRRVGLIFTISLISNVVCTFSTLFIGLIIFGGASSLLNPIQSIEMFKDCMLNVNVAEFIIIKIVLESLALAAFLLICWFILQLFNNRNLGIIIITAITIAEYILNKKIIDQSNFVILKYFNLYMLIDPGTVLYKYTNINVSGNVVNTFNLHIYLIVIVALISSILCILTYVIKKPVHSKGKLAIWATLFLKKINSFWQYILSKSGLLIMELYKVIVVHKGALFFLVIVIYAVCSINKEQIVYSGNSVLMKNVYTEYGGTLSSKLYDYRDYLNSEVEEVDILYNETIEAYENRKATKEDVEYVSNKAMGVIGKRKCLDTINEKINYLEQLKNDKGIDGYFMDEKPYNMLWSSNGFYLGEGFKRQQKYCMLGVLALIFLIYLLTTIQP